jgi:drug/metabolite transporter (DMT)-like permease
MQRGDVVGATYATAAMAFVGSSVAASSLVTDYPIFAGQGLRYGLGALALAAFARRSLARLRAEHLPRMLLLSSTGLAGFNVFLIAALRRAEAGSVGVIIGCVPVALAVVVPVLERRPPKTRVLAAALLVSAGAAAVQWAGGGMSLAGFGFAFAAMACEVAFTLFAVPLLGSLGPVGVSTYACAGAATLLIGGSLVTSGWSDFRTPSVEEAVALGYLAVFVTAIAFVYWYSAVERLRAERAGLFAGLVPVVALLTSAAVGTADLSPVRLLGSIAVGAGVVFGVREGPSAV